MTRNNPARSTRRRIAVWLYSGIFATIGTVLAFAAGFDWTGWQGILIQIMCLGLGGVAWLLIVSATLILMTATLGITDGIVQSAVSSFAVFFAIALLQATVASWLWSVIMRHRKSRHARSGLGEPGGIPGDPHL